MSNAKVVSAGWASTQPKKADPVVAEFRALGPVEAIVGGQLADLGAPKQRALLALLVSRVGEPVTVDLMLEELWAGHPPPSAMTSLQAYVANLRRALEPGRAPRTPATVLRTRGRGYLLDSRVSEVDVREFGERATAGWQASERGDPQRALAEFEAGLALWRGQAYADVADAASVIPEIARLEELRLSTVEGRCAALLAVGAHEVAVAELEAFMQAHPLREYGCELLSLALYRAGRQAEALAVLRTNQERLASELGIDPRPALQHLEHQILNQAPELDWRSPPATPAPRPASLADTSIFTGRHEPLGQLADALAAATAGHGRVVTITGEPGIGKTSLLRHFATQTPTPVLWSTCPEHLTPPPLWPWEQILRAAAAHLPHHPVPPPVTDLLNTDTQPADDTDTTALRRYEAVITYLTTASRIAPLILVMDHLHRADPSTLNLLAHLTETIPATRLLIAITYRPGEAGSLTETAAALARAGLTRIELNGLTIPDTGALASAILDRDIPATTAEALWTRTEGNPFFLRELIKQLAADHHLDHPHSAPVPTPVRDVVLRRVNQLPPTTARLLSIAAVAGRDFNIDTISHAARIPTDSALDNLDTAITAALITEDPHHIGWFRFSHPLTADALYETTRPTRRAYLHRRIHATTETTRHGRGTVHLTPSTA